MKFIFSFLKHVSIVLLVSGFVFPVQASEDKFGIGVIAGSPTGVTIKNWLDKKAAIDMAIDWSTSGTDKFYLQADYLLHDYSLLQPKDIKGKIAVYYGLGVFFQLVDNTQGVDDIVGLRLPVGLSYFIPKSPVEIFVEIIPLLVVSPDSDFDVESAIGARYYF